MSPGPVTGELRAVLDAPRGRRFSRPGTSARLMVPPLSDSEFRAREQRLLAQMADNPRVAHRQTHGVLPHWMHLQAARIAERERQAREDTEHSERLEGPWKPSPSPAPHHRPLPEIPRPRPAPDDGPPPPQPPRPPRPPLPRRPRRPHSHRKPRHRSRVAWHLCGYTLATLAGAPAHHLALGLL